MSLYVLFALCQGHVCERLTKNDDIKKKLSKEPFPENRAAARFSLKYMTPHNKLEVRTCGIYFKAVAKRGYGGYNPPPARPKVKFHP